MYTLKERIEILREETEKPAPFWLILLAVLTTAIVVVGPFYF